MSAKKQKISFEDDVNELTIKKFKELNDINKDYEEGLVDDVEYMNTYINIFTTSDWSNLDIDSRTFLYTKFKEIRFDLKEEPLKSFEINKITYKLIDIEQITYGEYIDLKTFMNDYYNNLEKIAALVYREKSEYDFNDIEERSIIFYNNAKIGWLNGIHNLFIKLMEKLQTLQLQNMAKETYDKNSEDSEIQDFIDRWGDYITIYDLANGDLLKYDQVLRLKIVDIFVFYAYKEMLKQVQKSI